MPITPSLSRSKDQYHRCRGRNIIATIIMVQTVTKIRSPAKDHPAAMLSIAMSSMAMPTISPIPEPMEALIAKG